MQTIRNSNIEKPAAGTFHVLYYLIHKAIHFSNFIHELKEIPYGKKGCDREGLGSAG